MKILQNKLMVGIFIFMQMMAVPIWAQEQKISVKQMHKDIRFYFSTIKKVHPNVYAFAKPETVDSVEKNLYKRSLFLKHLLNLPH